jgi:ActR/RegA family two-component response regulator
MTRGLADKHILIVEDEYIIALDIATEVAARGAVVIGPVGTVDAAVEAIKNTGVDSAILDLNLRGREAFPVADALADRHIPFVFATGYTIADALPARHANVRRLEKPTPPSDICCALEAAMSATREEKLFRLRAPRCISSFGKVDRNCDE